MTESISSRQIQNALDALRKASKGLGAYHMSSCVRCGLCGTSCHIYLTDPIPENLPVVKANKVASFFRKYSTLIGRAFPFLSGARSINPDTLQDLVETAYGRCTCCGRCAVNCSIGVDVASVISIGRSILVAAKMVPPNLQSVVNNQINTGNQMAITPDELKETAKWISEELRIETNDESINIQVDYPDKNVFYLINPREVKFFPLSFSAAAGIFHAASESWTTSSGFYDVTNYGLFASDSESAALITKQAIDEALKLNAKEIVLSECGHGFRSFRWEGPNWLGQKYSLPMRSILEVMLEYIETGRVRLDPSKNTLRVTLHDPCNLVRWGGIIEPQRKILRKAVTDFVEMTPNREQNYCCGGGGGLLSMSEYGERRVLSGKIKAEQIQATGAKIIATPCHNCADQLIELNKRYKLGIEIQSVTELVYNALILR